MNLRHFPACAAVLLVLGASAAHAQTKITAVPNTRAPTAAATANAGAPNPAGLASPQRFPQGLPDVTTPNLSSPGSTPPGTPVSPSDAAIADQAPSGTAVVGGPGVPAGPQTVPGGPSGYSNVQIAASFRRADANLDGQLTRAEAQRLTIMPATFEEMDRNKDGILTRSEYEDGVR